ncbi:Aldehyde dehydrogenase [Mortierella claussenii]|nr:Aldehyde dehydrogenase [Mortierella claussenii]
MTEQDILKFSSDSEIDQAALIAHETFKSRSTRPLDFRRRQLEQLWNLLDENVEELCEAVHKDLRKPRIETILAEILVSKEEINDALNHLDEWTKEEHVDAALVNRLGTICVKRKEPKGAALLIAPWNYPVYLVTTPFAGAIAAGCTVVIKPSELSPHTAKVITELLPRYLDQRAFQVINGGVQETTRLLDHKWDHIFYTGNGSVAKVIMKAAAKNLTSLTLELGGKSPAIVDENTNLTVAAKRIAFGKGFNTGQTCIAPDYALVTAKAEPQFVEALRTAFMELYGPDPQSSTSYGRIINARHFHRLHKLIQSSNDSSGEIVFGGHVDEKDLFISPTVITNVDREDKIMQEEIFGPILPIIRIADIDDAIEYINSKDDPLSLYLFSTNKKLIKKVVESTRSGGVVVNDTLMQATEASLPFGGIGPSGMGSYHGKSSFDTFTHVRSVMIRPMNSVVEMPVRMRYAPYNDAKLWIMRWVAESTPYFKKNFLMRYYKWIIFVVLLGVGYKRALE